MNLASTIRSLVLCGIALAGTHVHAASWSIGTQARLVARAPEAGIVAGADDRYWISASNYAGDSLLIQVDAFAGTAPTALPLESEALALAASADGGAYVATTASLGESEQVMRVGADGTPRWASSVGSLSDDVRLRGYANGDVLAFGASVGFSGGKLRLVRVRGADGAIAWSSATDVTSAQCSYINTVALTAGNRIVVACGANDPTPLLVFDGATGALVDTVPLAIDGALARIGSVASNEAADVFAVLDAGSERRVARFDATTRTTRWVSAPGVGYDFIFAIDANQVFVSSGGSEQIAALRRSDGVVAWRRSGEDFALGAAGTGYLIDRGGIGVATVFGINTATGVERWTQPLSSSYEFDSGARYLAGSSAGLALLRPDGPETRRTLAVESWSATGQHRTPFEPTAPSSRYAYVDQSGTSLLVARDESDGASSRTYARAIDGDSGAIRWETLAHSSTTTELAAAGTCHASDGTVVVAATAAGASSFRPVGVSRIAGFDADTGAERWHVDVGGGIVNGYVENVLCDGARHVYASAARRTGDAAGTTTLLAIDSATGAVLWDVPVASGRSRADLAFTERSATEPLLRGFSQGAGQLEMISAANGATHWTTALPGVLNFGTAIRAGGGDPVQLSQIGTPATSWDVVVHRVDAATGAIRWSRRIDGPYGGLQTAQSLSRGPSDEIYAMWRNSESLTGRDAIARLDGATGEIAWNVEPPGVAGWQAQLANVRVRPGQNRLQLRRQSFLPLDPTRGERQSLLTLDATTGAFVDSRDFGSGSSMDPGPYTYAPAQLAVLADGSMLSRRFVGGIGAQQEMVLRREPATPEASGNGTAILSLGAATGTNPRRIPFRMEARWQGASRVSGAVLRSVFPGNVVIASAQCRVEGGGECGSASRLRQWRQPVSLDPGARAIVEGVVEVAIAEPQLLPFQAWLELPFAVADTDERDNVATTRPGRDGATDLVADQRFSGSWFNPQRSGEGWILELLPDGSALLFWFTYPEAGAAGDQQWLIAQNGHVQGSRIYFDEIYATSGTRFGGGFNASDVRLRRWGEITMDFSDCDSGTILYTSRGASGGSPRNIVRLTSLAGVECGGPSSPPSAIRSGAWYDTQRAGEGWIVEALPDGRATVYWFTYSPDGNQAWTFGTGTLVGDRLRIDDMRRPRGTRFGTGFNPANVNVAPWGTLQIDFSGCNGGTLSYTSSEAGYEPATRNITRLTRIAGTNCP